MNKFEIITDSCCDLPIEYLKEKKVEYVSLTCCYEGNEYLDDLGQTLTSKQFFDDLRRGAIPTTSQPSVNAFYEKFKAVTEKHKAVLYVGVSTGMSGAFNSANIARDMILEENKEAEIYSVDILTASLGHGILVMKACEMKEAGSTIEEIKEYLEGNKQFLNTYLTVNDLNYLKRGGRISQAAAVLGIVLHIKPIITINHEGKVMPILKIKGRKKAIDKLADILFERIENPEEQIIAISHGDCIEEAEKLRDIIQAQIKVKDVLINPIGPAVGAHGGPGALALFFMGKARQHHSVE